MPNCKKLIDPTKDAVAHWLKHARLGDQCQIITAQGDVYANLTKLKPDTANLLATAFEKQDSFVSNQLGFMKLLETLSNAHSQPSSPPKSLGIVLDSPEELCSVAE